MMDYAKMGNHLKELRDSYGLTREEAAELAGICARELLNIERGRVKPKLVTAKRLCVVYGITLGNLDQFFTEDESMETAWEYMQKKKSLPAMAKSVG